jgi:hypothetical protein
LKPAQQPAEFLKLAPATTLVVIRVIDHLIIIVSDIVPVVQESSDGAQDVPRLEPDQDGAQAIQRADGFSQ